MGRDYALAPLAVARPGATPATCSGAIGPTRVNRDTPRAYMPATPRRTPDSASSPYERARRCQDRGTVRRGPPAPQGETPGGAIRRTVPRSDPPAERPSYSERSVSRPRPSPDEGNGQGSQSCAGTRERQSGRRRRSAPRYVRPRGPGAARPGRRGGSRARSRERPSSRPSEGRVESSDSGRRSSSGGSSGDRSPQPRALAAPSAGLS